MNTNPNRRREGGFEPKGFLKVFSSMCQVFLYCSCFFSIEQHMFIFLIRVHSCNRIWNIWREGGFDPKSFYYIFWNMFICFVLVFFVKKQGMFVLLVWISVHSCSRIQHILTSNLLGKPRIHCETACRRLLNVCVEAFFKHICNFAPRISTYTMSNSWFAFV